VTIPPSDLAVQYGCRLPVIDTKLIKVHTNTWNKPKWENRITGKKICAMMTSCYTLRNCIIGN